MELAKEGSLDLKTTVTCLGQLSYRQGKESLGELREHFHDSDSLTIILEELLAGVSRSQ